MPSRELAPILNRNAKALDDHLTELEDQIFVMVQGLGSLGAGRPPGVRAGMPSGTPNHGGLAPPGFPVPPVNPPQMSGGGSYGMATPTTLPVAAPVLQQHR